MGKLWSGSLEGATARITAFCSVLLEANEVRALDKAWKCRDRSANLLRPKQLKSHLEGVIPLVGDADLNQLKGGIFISGIYSEKSSRKVYMGNLSYL